MDDRHFSYITKLGKNNNWKNLLPTSSFLVRFVSFFVRFVIFLVGFPISLSVIRYLLHPLLLLLFIHCTLSILEVIQNSHSFGE